MDLEELSECPVEKWCPQECPEDKDYQECPNYMRIVKGVFPGFAEYEERVLKARKL